MAAYDWLRSAAARRPTTVAVGDREDSLTFAELDHRASETARRLLGDGVEPGTSALLELGEGLGKVVQIHALIRLGVTVTPIETGLPAGERERAIEAAGPDHSLGPEDGLAGPAGPDLPAAEWGESQVVCRILTGGSTGAPKAIALTRANHFMSAVGSALNLGVTPDDRWLCSVSLSHVSGFAILIRSAIYGTGFLIEDRFDPASVRDSIASGGVNALSLVPTMLSRVLADGPVPGALRFALVGGGPVPVELIEGAIRAGLPVVPTYGLTEACSQVATSTPEGARRLPSSAGLPLPATEVRTVEGEIEVRGPTVSPDAANDDGWLATGDLGRLDEDGHLFVEGRKDRLILTGGEKVQPVEVEAALLSHPAVAGAAVLAVPDREWQQAVVAVVVASPGERPDEEQLREFCRSMLPGFKVPKRIVLRDRIPVNRAGKTDYAALSDLLAGSSE